jgi:SAM-dependent methyltransferase
MSNENNTPERLALRIQLNMQGKENLEDFMLNLVHPEPQDTVLEIGCGSGKQMRVFAPLVHSMLCTDVSQDLLDVAQNDGIPENVRLMQLDMDEAASTLSGRYSLIYSVYALYYSKDVNALIENIGKKLLAENGRFLCVAPDTNNNRQWFEDLETLFPLPEDIAQSPTVSRSKILPAMLDTFQSISCQRFRNSLTFFSVDEVMRYYDACVYCPVEKRAQAQQFFARKMGATGSYVITKCALGMLGRS